MSDLSGIANAAGGSTDNANVGTGKQSSGRVMSAPGGPSSSNVAQAVSPVSPRQKAPKGKLQPGPSSSQVAQKMQPQQKPNMMPGVPPPHPGVSPPFPDARSGAMTIMSNGVPIMPPPHGFLMANAMPRVPPTFAPGMTGLLGTKPPKGF